MASIDEKVESILCVLYFRFRGKVRRVISYYFFFLPFLLIYGQHFDHSPTVFLLGTTEGTMWEGIIVFLSQTVIIMQLVFECSFDTNVYHFKLVFRVFFTV